MTDSGSVVGVTGHTPSALELDRRAFRRGRERRSVLMAVASTLVFAAIVWVTVINTPGWTKVQETFFDPATAWEALPKVWDGFLLNLTVLGISVFTVAIVALLVAVLRTLRGPVFFPVRVLAAAYTDLFRGLPFIIVLYLVGYGLPTIAGVRIPVVVLGVLAVVGLVSAGLAVHVSLIPA